MFQAIYEKLLELDHKLNHLLSEAREAKKEERPFHYHKNQKCYKDPRACR